MREFDKKVFRILCLEATKKERAAENYIGRA
jgi:hypothetical protein